MIEIKKISYKYPGSSKLALENIDLKIEEGQYIAILGHNGSGKSTFSKLLSAIYKPTSGKIIIDGLEINSENLLEIRKKLESYFKILITNLLVQQLKMILLLVLKIKC